MKQARKQTPNLEWPQLDVPLHDGVTPLTANQPLGIEDGVLGVRSQLVLGRIADQSLAVFREGHVGRRDAVALVVGDDFHSAVLEDAHTEKTP